MQNPVTRTSGNEASRADAEAIDLGWDDVREAIRQRWPRLTDNDLAALASEHAAFMSGNYQLIVGRLRERYGLGEFEAQDQVRRFIRSISVEVGGSSGPQHSTPTRGSGKPSTGIL